MAPWDQDNKGFGPSELLDCYANGVFPMADSRDDPRLFLVDPQLRGILPLDHFHVSRRLARTVRHDRYQVRVNTAFDAVLEGCAAVRRDTEETWINQPIQALYRALHAQGHAHSVETWDDERLVGGLYGVSLGAAFFGESMFSLARDASKVALVFLVAGLRRSGFALLDTQFQTEHLKQFGTVEISREAYHQMLRPLVNQPRSFPGASFPQTGAQALQAMPPA